MFMYPEPPPIDYVLEDVSLTLLSDGIFLYGKPGPTHKYIGKQLRPIKRKITDPVAPPTELDPRTLNVLAEKEGSWYAQSKDAFLIYEISSFIKQLKYSNRDDISPVSLFPRSKKYEYQYIKEKRLEDVPKETFFDKFQCGVKDEKKEDISKPDEEPCYILKPPFWWKDKSRKQLKLPIGYINDYAYDRSEYTEQGFDYANHEIEKFIVEILEKKLVTLLKYQTVKKDVEDIANCREKKLLKVESPVKCPIEKDGYTPKKSDVKTEIRWQPLYKLTQFPKTTKKRKEELQMLTKPYLHELNTWYAKNLPTKLHLPVRLKGKRPMPEWRFSHILSKVTVIFLRLLTHEVIEV
ncbi:hypothetical protein HZH66_015426 [Vespula vulgaris]|uniref:Uncharacterized protein n=1 Tax=Vespula vulgaris TaxID=7454 RepID=A0A834IXJ9_VESVU|nr:hypothetical protein HZH66_015426 [Vespula vulgaris]